MQLAADGAHGYAIERYALVGIAGRQAMVNRLRELWQREWVNEAGQGVGIEIW
jgi:hypothetical protein